MITNFEILSQTEAYRILDLKNCLNFRQKNLSEPQTYENSRILSLFLEPNQTN